MSGREDHLTADILLINTFLTTLIYIINQEFLFNTRFLSRFWALGTTPLPKRRSVFTANTALIEQSPPHSGAKKSKIFMRMQF